VNVTGLVSVTIFVFIHFMIHFLRPSGHKRAPLNILKNVVFVNVKTQCRIKKSPCFAVCFRMAKQGEK
jgi:hypothetical protein